MVAGMEEGREEGDSRGWGIVEAAWSVWISGSPKKYSLLRAA